MMLIGSQNVNVEVVHYQVTVGLFSRPLGASEPERSLSRGTLKHTAGHVDWTCASRLLCGRSLCYRNTEYRNDFLLLFPQNSPPTVLKESLRTRQFSLKHCRQHRLFVCDNEPPQTLDERHCFQKNLWFCSPRYEHWKWKDERRVFKYLKWVYPGGVLSLWTCGGAEKRLCSAGPGATRVFGPGPRVWCLSAGSHQCIQNKFAVDIRDKLNSLVLALFVCECQNLSAVIGADSDHLLFRCVNEWEQLAANQGVTTRRRPLTKAEECCESLWSF